MSNLIGCCRSHDNSRIVSAGADKMVLVLDVGTGQPIRKLRGHLSVSVVCECSVWVCGVCGCVECVGVCVCGVCGRVRGDGVFTFIKGQLELPTK